MYTEYTTPNISPNMKSMSIYPDLGSQIYLKSYTFIYCVRIIKNVNLFLFAKAIAI